MDNELAGPAGVGGVLNNAPNPAHLPDQVSYFYIKNVKRWMECPVCGDKLRFGKASESWMCGSCGFDLPEAEFLDGYVFWFCDQCESFLNVQEGFGVDGGSWTCAECGFVNDVSEDNLVGTCCECGALLDNPEASLCADCNDAWVAARGAGGSQR